ncbi:MAG: glycosyltransferase [Treponema sp.]|nr:glycosyltransferase [Treponema sp.]
MSDTSFSFIIPVYNDETNISRCLDSILKQTLSDFECIVIDDGSTDNSLSICYSYNKNDSRVRVFHKENEGISKTRQFGLNNAFGEYIYFVDSDDWIEPFLLEKFKNDIKNNTDITFLDFFEENKKCKEEYHSQKITVYNTEKVLRKILEGKLYSCLWNVIIKKDFYNKNNIFFYENINYGEDSLYIIELLLNNPRIKYLQGGFYHHSINNNSYTRTDKKQKYIERVNFLNELPCLLTKYNRPELLEINFFPLNDKFEIFNSFTLTKREYQFLYKISLTSYYRYCYGFYRYFLLLTAESFLFYPLKYSIYLLKLIKNKLGK